MKKIYLIIILIIIVVLGIYINRSYAYIYNKTSQDNLLSPDKSQTYIIESMKNDKDLIYVAVGDSLTAGVGVDNYKESYPYLLSEKMSGEGNIILKNRSIPGFTTGNLKNELLSLAILDKPNIVTLLIGVNDIHNQISKKDFEENYDEILKELTTKTTAKIYLINIPYIGSSKLILPPYNLYFDFETKQFNKIIENLAQKYNLTYINLYSASKTEFEKSDSYYAKDLFHPSAKGYAMWANIIFANIYK
ncbi:MAG: SGNH/GDSL hydrolase family protein [Candidatus Staskawiczbacteria bacterium]|jgi:lysophospholipase L1-like esterase